MKCLLTEDLGVPYFQTNPDILKMKQKMQLQISQEFNLGSEESCYYAAEVPFFA